MNIPSHSTSSQKISIGFGIPSFDSNNNPLDVFYYMLGHNPSNKLLQTLKDLGYIHFDSPETIQNQSNKITQKQREQLTSIAEEHFNYSLDANAIHNGTICTVTSIDSTINSVPEAYLKLHMLSHRLAKPNTLNLTNLFSVLPNLAWTSEGPISLEDLPYRQLNARNNGKHIHIFSMDKFPQMTNYVVPSGIRIGDASRIRLGAYIGSGTTVMHEGFINFNAGTAGPNMIEGRISQGVYVDENTDLGGGCSTMGTLSGGGNIRISIGKHCLLGANSGVGISLGNACTIEAGLYITASMYVSVIDEAGKTTESVKARELSGKDNMLFIRNSKTGIVECRVNKSPVELNALLHQQ